MLPWSFVWIALSVLVAAPPDLQGSPGSPGPQGGLERVSSVARVAHPKGWSFLDSSTGQALGEVERTLEGMYIHLARADAASFHTSPAFPHILASPDGRTVVTYGDIEDALHERQSTVRIFRDGTLLHEDVARWTPDLGVAIGPDGTVLLAGREVAALDRCAMRIIDAQGEVTEVRPPAGLVARDLCAVSGAFAALLLPQDGSSFGSELARIDAAGLHVLTHGLDARALFLLDDERALSLDPRGLHCLRLATGERLWTHASQRRPVSRYAAAAWGERVIVLAQRVQGVGEPQHAVHLELIDAGSGRLLEALPVQGTRPPLARLSTAGDLLLMTWTDRIDSYRMQP